MDSSQCAVNKIFSFLLILQIEIMAFKAPVGYDYVHEIGCVL